MNESPESLASPESVRAVDKAFEQFYEAIYIEDAYHHALSSLPREEFVVAMRRVFPPLVDTIAAARMGNLARIVAEEP